MNSFFLSRPILTRLTIFHLFGAGVCMFIVAPSTNAHAQSTTSTASVFPEEGGPLIRAPIPESGASKEVPPAAAWALRWNGYVRVVADVIENDALSFIGRNDGFRLDDARLALSAAFGSQFRAELSIEAALARAGQLNDPNASLAMGLRDAYFEYDISKVARVRVGRMKAPYDIANLESTEARAFIDAPLESRGVKRTQGLETLTPGTGYSGGLGVGRQLGAMLHTERVGLTENGFDLGYALAVTNGFTGDRVLNDNDSIAALVRLTVRAGDIAALNIGGFLDRRTAGDLPNLFDTTVWGGEGSVVCSFADLRIEGQILVQHVTPETSQAVDYLAMGVHGQWSYRIAGFEPAYRFAYYNPSDQTDLDVVTEHTLGIAYYLDSVPLKVAVNGALVGEQRSIDNNRLSVLAQYVLP